LKSQGALLDHGRYRAHRCLLIRSNLVVPDGKRLAEDAALIDKFARVPRLRR
jgi:hypothetical protein